MPLKTFKPYTKSTRGTVLVDKTGLWKGKPFKKLVQQKYFKIQFFGRGFRISAPGGYNAYHLANCIIDEMRRGLTIPERKAVA